MGTTENTNNVTYYAKYEISVRTYYVENTQNWSGDLYAHAWNTSGGATDYIKMTDTNKTNSGHKVYKVTVSLDYTHILFNANGGNDQTIDIDINSIYGNNNCIWIKADKTDNRNQIGGSFNFTE